MDSHFDFAQLIASKGVRVKGVSWALQEIQNTLAYYEDLPVRLVGKTAVLRLGEQHTRLTKLNFPFREPGYGFIALQESEEARDIANSVATELWTSEGSYSNPLLTAFREEKYWRLWETLWVLNVATHFLSHKYTSYKAYPLEGFCHRQLVVMVGEVSELNGLLFGGPVWSWKPTNSLGRDNGRVMSGGALTKQLARKFVASLRARNRDRPDLPRQFSTHLRRLERLGGVRAAITKYDLEYRVDKICKALATAARTTAEHDQLLQWYESEVLGSNHWVGLAHVCLLIHSKKIREELDSVTTFLYRPPTQQHEELKPINADVVLKASKNDVKWTVSFVRERLSASDLSTDGISGRIDLRGDVQGSQARSVDVYVSRVVDRIHTSRNYFLEERLRLIRFRLEDHFIQWGRDGSEKRSTSSITTTSLPPPILRTICFILNMEVGAIYQYDHLNKRLRMLHANYPTRRQLEEYERSTHDLMWYAGADKTLRGRSICYQAVDTAEPQIRPLLEHGQLVLPPGDHSAQGSAVATPIEIYGRPWGVLELRGGRRGQMRESTPRWAHEFSRTISHILYSQWTKRLLHSLNQGVMNALQSELLDYEVGYKSLAESLLHVFLVDTVSIWLRQRQGPTSNRYVCIQSINHPEKGNEPHRGPLDFSPSDKSTLSAKLIESEWPYYTGDLSVDFEEGRKFAEGHYASSLRVHGHHHYLVFKIRDRRDQCIGVVWLVGKGPHGFEHRWDGLARYFSNYVGLVVELIHSRQHFVDDRLTQSSHEIGGTAEQIADAVQVVEQRLEPLFNDEYLIDKVPDFVASLELLRHQHEMRSDAMTPHYEDIKKSLLELCVIEEDALPRTRAAAIYAAFERLRGFSESVQHSVKRLLQGEDWDEKHPVRLPPAENFRRVLESAYEGELRSHGRIVQYTGPQSGPFLRVHREPLRIVLRNLINNGIKYNVGKAPLRISVRTNVDQYCIVEFRNIGWGLHENEGAEDLLTSGFRASRTVDLWPEGGTGLGLSDVRVQVRRMGLEIIVDAGSIKRSHLVNWKNESIRAFKAARGHSPSTEDFALFSFSLRVPAALIDEEGL